MIFVDTSFWVAGMASADAHHQAAVALLRELADENLITSNLVRGETWTFTRRRHGHQAAVRFLDRLERSPRVKIKRALAFDGDFTAAGFTELRS